MIDQIIAIVGVTLLVMISPGPDMIIVARNTLFLGRADGFLTSLGVLAGNLMHITYCVIGIGWLISQSILAFNVLKYAGVAYLIFLGIKSLRAKPLDLQEMTEKKERKVNRGSFIQGFLNNILNPKGTLFYLGVFTVMIDPTASSIEILVLVIAMVSVSASFWVLFVLTLDRKPVRLLLKKSQTAVNRTFGVLLIALGIRVAFLER